MRATINGITVEGTPQEIAEYRELTEVTIEQQQPPGYMLIPRTTCGQTSPVDAHKYTSGDIPNVSWADQNSYFKELIIK